MVHVESAVVDDREKLMELNETFHREMQELHDLKNSIGVIGYGKRREIEEGMVHC